MSEDLMRPHIADHRKVHGTTNYLTLNEGIVILDYAKTRRVEGKWFNTDNFGNPKDKSVETPYPLTPYQMKEFAVRKGCYFIISLYLPMSINT